IKYTILIITFAFALWGCNEKVTETNPTIPNETKQEETSNLVAPDVELTEVNKPVLYKYTSTGCPGCGSWGAPTFEGIADELKNDIVPLAVHIKYGDPMITDISNEIADNRVGQRFTSALDK
ncbi:MAG: thioredoxin family protein, partial [Bacteroidia bacterium]